MIRSYNHADFSIFKELFMDCFVGDYRLAYTDAEFLRLCKGIDKSVYDKTVYLDLIETDSRVIGFVLYQVDSPESDFCQKEGWGTIREIFVCQPFRGRGFGRLAVWQTEQRLFELGATSLYITTDDAQSFWTHMGYADSHELCTANDCQIFVKEGSVFNNCPRFETDSFVMRLVEADDAEGLLPCYQRPTDSVITNSFNCDFGYSQKTLEQMRQAIDNWRRACMNSVFVRWSIVSKRHKRAVGTLEIYKRQAKDYFTDCGVIRLDLHSKHEATKPIAEILSPFVPAALELFGCKMLATRVAPTAKPRITALKSLGFSPSTEQAHGDAGKVFDDFWVFKR